MTTLSTVLSADFLSTCPHASHCLCHKNVKKLIEVFSIQKMLGHASNNCKLYIKKL